MANFKYFRDEANGETIQFSRVNYNTAKDIKGFDETAQKWVQVTRVVQIKSCPSRHACDSRCYNASGRVMKCECSCNGKNHGKGEFFCVAA